MFDFLPDAAEGLVKSLASQFAGKAATGLTNYLLMKRLGYRVMQMLKPRFADLNPPLFFTNRAEADYRTA